MKTEKPTRDEANSSERMTMPGSMSRSIYCDGCTQLFLKIDGGGGCCRCFRGRARGDYLCDFCNRPLPQNSECFALSVFEQPEDYRPWEVEFLKDTHVVQTEEPAEPPRMPPVHDEPSHNIARDSAPTSPSWKRQAGKRCRLQGHSPTVTVIVGWDRPMWTYFAQVWDTPPGAAHYEHGKLLLWLGTAWEEVGTVEELSEALKAHATIPADLRKLLGEFPWQDSTDGEQGDFE